MHINDTSTEVKLSGANPRSIPILFQEKMVRAILNTRPDKTAIDQGKPAKWQTRRIVKPSQTPPRIAPTEMTPWIIEIDGEQEVDESGRLLWVGLHLDYPTGRKWFSCPYGSRGTELWVRETWSTDDGTTFIYKADFPAQEQLKWKPSIHLPRSACRLRLTVRDITVERIQNISPQDCQAEGIAVYEDQALVPAGSDKLTDKIYLERFIQLWESINGSRGMGWNVNPWCWVIEFEVKA